MNRFTHLGDIILPILEIICILTGKCHIYLKYLANISAPDKKGKQGKYNFLISLQNICCDLSLGQFYRDSSNKGSKH